MLAKEKQLVVIERKMQQLHDIKQYPIGEVEFLKLAVEQVIRCRRVLKWTYVFGYYLNPGIEKNLFEHLQEKLEENTDHLHELVERPLDEYLDVNTTDKSRFYHYKSDLINYYQVTKNFFENLLDGIENGLTS
jgi:ariadne-1